MEQVRQAHPIHHEFGPKRYPVGSIPSDEDYLYGVDIISLLYVPVYFPPELLRVLVHSSKVFRVHQLGAATSNPLSALMNVYKLRF
jgi:hypothetical protein